jgi:HPt (histidine-containing phosphotransfer) domain-containing protein
MSEMLELRVWQVVNQFENQLGVMTDTLQQMNELGAKDWLSAGVTVIAYMAGHYQATRSAKKQAAQLECHRLEDKLRKLKESRTKLAAHVIEIDAQARIISLNCRSFFLPIDINWEGILDEYDKNVHKVANRQFLIDTCELEFEARITELQDAIGNLFNAMFIRPIESEYMIGTKKWVEALGAKERKLGEAKDDFIKILDDAISDEQKQINALRV